MLHPHVQHFNVKTRKLVTVRGKPVQEPLSPLFVRLRWVPAGAATLLVMSNTCLSKLQELAECLIYGRGITEYLCHIGIEKNHVGSCTASAWKLSRQMISLAPVVQAGMGSNAPLP